MIVALYVVGYILVGIIVVAIAARHAVGPRLWNAMDYGCAACCVAVWPVIAPTFLVVGLGWLIGSLVERVADWIGR